MQAILLVGALPDKWDNVAARVLQSTRFNDLAFEPVHLAIVSEYEQTSSCSMTTIVDELSAVKCKGKSPALKDQKEKSKKFKELADDTEHCQRTKKHGGKWVRSNHDHQGHLHFASVSLVPEPPVASASTAAVPVPTQQIYLGEHDVPVSKAPPQGVVVSTKPHKIIYHPLNHSSAQSFTGQPKLSNVFLNQCMLENLLNH